MVYGSLSLISVLLFFKSHGVLAQCAGRIELLPPGSGIPSTAYIQPVGQVCFPAVIQLADNNHFNQPPPPPPQDEEDEYLNLIYLLIETLTGSSKKGNNSPSHNNRGHNNNNPIPSFEPFAFPPLIGNNNAPGYFDIPFCQKPGSSSKPVPEINQSPITISIDTSNPSSGFCEACSGCSFPQLPYPLPGILPQAGNAPTSGQNNGYSPIYVPDNSGSGCIYVPYPFPLPYNIPGCNYNDIYYPENEYGPQEINLIIKTECD